MLEGQIIKSLSWKEPYGTLMLPPWNKIETRTWHTNYRGLILICTSKNAYRIDVVAGISGTQQYNRILDLCDHIKFIDGHAIAIGRLVDCRLMTPEDQDQCFVEYVEPWKVINKKGKVIVKKLYCHVYEDVRPIKPISWNGSQGFRNVAPEIIKQIEFLKTTI